nr:hypothetical protein [uncultured bacterium]
MYSRVLFFSNLSFLSLKDRDRVLNFFLWGLLKLKSMLFPPSARKVSLFVVKSELNLVLKAFLMRLTWDRMA